MSFLRAYEAFVGKSTDAPVEFGHAAGLSCISTIALGRRWIDRGMGIRPNIFLLLTADSSKDRKSTSVNLAVELLKEVDEDRLAPGDFTAEGLVSFMRKRKDGESRSKLLIAMSEFGRYLAASRSYGVTASSMLCDLYDGETFSRVRSGKRPLVIDKPRVSLLGAVAYGMLEKYADPLDWVTGFFARMLFVTPKTRPPRYEAQPTKPKMERDVARALLTDLREQLRAEKPKPMAVLANADALYGEWVRRFAEELPEPAMMAARERLLNSAYKLAMLYQLDLNPGQPIGEEAMAKATDFAQSCWQSFTVVYGATSGDTFSRILRRLWKTISDSGTRGVARRDLLRRFNANASMVMSALDVLTKMDAVAVKQVPNEGKGRPSTVVVALGPYTE